MKQGYIYKITSPSGKNYIGQTVSIRNRKNQYSSCQCKNQILLYNSIKKYGWVNHTFDIIEEITIIDKDKTLINEREKFWISAFKSFGEMGLNCNAGGEGNVGRKLSDETKKKIGLIHKGRKVSDETKEKLKGNKNRLGKIHTNEAKKKISESKKGKKVSDETKEKIRNWNKNKITSQETKKKISDAAKGRTVDETTKKKISESKKGKPWSEARRLAQKNNYESI